MSELLELRASIIREGGRRGLTIKNSFLWLCRVPELPNDYSHTYMFNDKFEQKKFFESKTSDLYKFENLKYLKKEQSFKINKPYDVVKKLFNYAVFSNDTDIGAEDGKIYYAFINDMEYINEHTTKIYLQLDIIQTYMFDFDLKPSYVDRLHVDRWHNDGRPREEVEPENLEFGDHIQVDRELLHQYVDQYIMVSKNPLGFIIKKAPPGSPTWYPSDQSHHNPPNPLPPSGGAPNPTPSYGNKPLQGPSGTCWNQKKPSIQVFRFMKSAIGFSKNSYTDSDGDVRIGYGARQGDRGFSEMISNQPVSEETASRYLWQSLLASYNTNPVYKKIQKWGLDKQCYFDAILSYTYFLGEIYLDESNILPYFIQEHKWYDVRNQWVRDHIYNKDGSINPDKLYTRTQEMHMFFGEEYDVRKIPTINGSGIVDGALGNDGWLPSVGQDGTCNQGGVS